MFLPGDFDGQRGPAGDSPWGHRELDVTEGVTHTHITHLFFQATSWSSVKA